MMTAVEQKRAAREFAAEWSGRGYEKGECQKFWRALLHDVFGIEDPDDWLQYEVPVATGYVDAYISRTKVLIEQKGFEHGLAGKAAMKQAMMYVGAMPDTMPVRYIVLPNFHEFWIYDKHSPEMKPVKVALRNLSKKLGVLSFLTEVRQTITIVRDVAAVDRKAGALVGRLYDALLKSYSGEVDDRTLESLNMLCVRLVFCAYAEDAGVFPKREQFTDYMRRFDAESFRDRLAQLFRVLNTDYPDRDPDDIPALLEFPYVGSGLFDDERMLFDDVRECTSDYIAIPKVSSERREYIPIEWLPKEIIPGDKLFMVPDAGLLHFGILTSSVHMAWMRIVAGRLKSDYSYSNTIVYNNFPWPEIKQSHQSNNRTMIERTAQGILDARALYPDSSLADLYDPLTMPPELRKAHQANDAAVLAAYGFSSKATESEIVTKLFEMYAEMTKHC